MYTPEQVQVSAAEDALLNEVWHIQALRRQNQENNNRGKAQRVQAIRESASELDKANKVLYELCHYRETEVLAARREALTRRYAPGRSESL